MSCAAVCTASLITFPLSDIRCWFGSEFSGVFRYHVRGVFDISSWDLVEHVQLCHRKRRHFSVVTVHQYLFLFGVFAIHLPFPRVQGCKCTVELF